MTPLSCSHPEPARRAFGTFMVLAYMVFLSLVVISMTALFAHEARLTRSALHQTQLRQLLMAAVPAAQAEMKSNSAPHDTTFPVPVEGAKVTLHVQPGAVQIDATWQNAHATQTLIFQNGKLVDATLDRAAN